MEYNNGIPNKVTSIVISTQHSPDLNQDQVREVITHILKDLFQKNFKRNIRKRNLY